MRKTRSALPLPLQIKMPPIRIRERFHVVYELEGAQKGVNFLAKYYRVKRMKVVFNGRKVCKAYIAYYLSGTAFFTRKGLEKRPVLHEMYHHIIEVYEIDLSSRVEEKEADNYAREFLKN